MTTSIRMGMEAIQFKAMTRSEISARFYKSRKENGLCPRCGEPLDRDGHYCGKCTEKVRIYYGENRAFYREHHICTACGKVKVPVSERTCPECRAKRYKGRKPLTDEQKKNYGEHFRAQQKSLYQQRKEQGICTRCGKRKSMAGKAKCGICLNKDAEMHRKRNFDKPNTKEYRRENRLCYYCGSEIDADKGQLCSTCLKRCRKNGNKGRKGNKYWEQDNKLVFMSKDICSKI